MNRIKLKVLGISYSQTQSGAYALVLAEEEGQRRIPIIIGGFEAQAIVIKLESLSPPRPLTHDLIHTLAGDFDIKIKEVLIYKLEEGVFYSQLVCTRDGEEKRIDSRTSDAVALALRFECPIFTTDEILEKAGIVISSDIDEPKKEDTPGSAEKIPYRKSGGEYAGLSIEELTVMLDEAVSGEDYEHAAAIRDELEKRKRMGQG